jgi:hypothetical protein
MLRPAEPKRIWNGLAGRNPSSLYCAYPIRALDIDAGAEQFREICAQHSAVVPTVG